MHAAIFLALLLGAASAYELELSMYDPEACVDSDLQRPITRVVDASLPTGLATPGFNFSDPDSVYPPNTICQWSIFVTDPAKEFALTFFNFTTEEASFCADDYVEVYDSADDSGLQLATLCGDLGTVNPYYPSGTEAFIRFVSDADDITGTGFVAKVGTQVEVTACDAATQPQVFTSAPGLFGSENYPINYRNGILCEYLFQAPAGQVVEIGFSNTDIEECCGCDHIEAFGGNSQAAPKLSHWYGTGKACGLRSSTNELYLRFESDISVTGQGFLGFYDFV